MCIACGRRCGSGCGYLGVLRSSAEHGDKNPSEGVFIPSEAGQRSLRFRVLEELSRSSHDSLRIRIFDLLKEDPSQRLGTERKREKAAWSSRSRRAPSLAVCTWRRGSPTASRRC